MTARLATLLVFVLAGLAFAPGLNGPLIHDDLSNLSLVQKHVTSLPEAIDVALSNGSGFLRRPISNASFLANFILTGESTLALKLTNLLLHLMTGILVYQLMLRLVPKLMPEASPTTQAGIALAASLIWTAHPLQVSTVLYVVQRMTVLSGLFSIAALLLVTSRTLSPPGWKRDTATLAAYLFFTALAVLSKETGAAVPLLFATIALSLRQHPSQHRPLIVGGCALPLLAGAVAFVSLWPGWAADYAQRDFTLTERLASEATILWQYIFHIAIPLPGKMHFFRDGVEALGPTDPKVITSLLAWATVLYMAIALRRRYPVLLFSLGWYLAGHALESSLVPLELAYEHRNYLPSIGPILLLTVTGHEVVSRYTRNLRPLALVAVGCLAIATAQRAFVWGSLERLSSHEVTVSPRSLRAHYAAMDAQFGRGDWAGVHQSIEAIRRIEPGTAWIETIPLIAKCSGDPAHIDIPHTERLLVRDAMDIRVARAMPPLLDLELGSHCLTRNNLDLENMLLRMADQARPAPRIASDYLYQSAWLAYYRGDLDAAADRLSAAHRFTPREDSILERLFHVELLRGNPDQAGVALSKLRSIWRQRPWRLHRLDMLESELSAAVPG